MTLQQLIEKIEKNEMNFEMYQCALDELKNNKDTYTLQEYTAILYVLGKYQEVKGQTVYCGIRIQHALTAPMYRVTKEDTYIAQPIIEFKDQIQKRVDNVTKLIDRRFMNVNIIMSIIIIFILQFFVKTHMFVNVLITMLSFMLNMIFVLPRSKKKFVEQQTKNLRQDLFEDFKNFEQEMV